eukprot:GEMP01039711.1.p1 GENE.GEMP01039711.1~~GEMP01039711.1.p1  ORF type:complete len:309 (-),score=78.64 GEMP01039711.1:993-1880(-)
MLASMATGKAWADEVEDDFPCPISGMSSEPTRCYESKPDANGVQTVIEYVTKDGVSYKVEKKIQVKTVQKKVNKAAVARRNMTPFGKAKPPEGDAPAFPGMSQVTKEDQEVTLELNAALKHKNIGDDEKFYEESIGISDALIDASRPKKKWDANAIRMDKITEQDSQPPLNKAAEQAAAVKMMQEAEKKGAYVPPSLRNKSRAELDQAREEVTLRVTNLSEDVRDGDLQALFSQFGHLQRVFLARYRDGDKEGQSKGFAFVTFNNRKDAETAMKRLHGHGYDNLILQVNWAKPRE